MAQTEGIGIGLSRRFYETLVAPILAQQFPDVPYAAARIGLGSEVLGYDTEMSADHDYGPCVQLFLPQAAFPATAREILEVLDRSLPELFEGWTIRYPTHVRPPAEFAESNMLGSDHGAELYTLDAWCEHFLGWKAAKELSNLDWLSCSEQHFLTVTGGAVFRDDLGDLMALRKHLDYFPRDVWLYKLASQWGRIAEERAYVGRTGSVGDDIGSRVIAARMVGNLMRLGLLIERCYAPYPKWLGTAFSSLPCAPDLTPLLDQALSASNWQDRERWLMEACSFLGELQMAREVPGAIAPAEATLGDRPFRFIDSVAISAALRTAIADNDLRQLRLFGGADQFISNNYVLAPDFAKTAATALFSLPGALEGQRP